MTACYCIGPSGNCPCIRRMKGLGPIDYDFPMPMGQTYVQKALKPHYKLRNNGERVLIGLLPLLMNARTI